MSASADQALYARVVDRFAPGSRLLRAYPLQGGISAQVTALELEQPDGQVHKLLLRRHGEIDLHANPHIARDEYRLLSLLHAAGLPTPRPYSVDESGEIFATPYLVIEYIEGQTTVAPANLQDCLLQFATHLARIHQSDLAQQDIAFLPEQSAKYANLPRAQPASADVSLREEAIRAALRGIWPLPQRNPTVLLHGDYWPGNLLWQDERLVAVIDWEDAARGDPLADVANSRLEMLWAFGSDAMRSFTQHYQALTSYDFAHLSAWELCAALRQAKHAAHWAGYPGGEQATRDGYRWFVSQAFERLAVEGMLRG